MGPLRKLRSTTIGLVALLATAGSAQAQSFMPTSSLSTQPVGHYEFCQRQPSECRKTAVHKPVELTRSLWATMVEINMVVNTMIAPRTDMEMWGVEEYWSYPTNGYGDCEDYVLEKRRQLMKAGVPASNLLITVVRQSNGEGHAVLTVNTAMGDFILDNLEPQILAWSETDYHYLKRQAPQHAGMWVGIEDSRDLLLVGSVDGKRR